MKPAADGHEDYLDLLRGVAIIQTMLVHFGGGWKFPPALDAVMHPLIVNGQRGVQLFFFLSAFTLTLSWQRKAQSTGQFFVRRFFRIVPIYWAAIAVSLLCDGFGPRVWLGAHQHIGGGDIALNALLVHWTWPWAFNSVVPGGWSLGVEAAFYALFPLLIRRCVGRPQFTLVLLATTLAAQQLLSFLLKTHGPTDDPWLWEMYLFFYPPTQLPFFIFGILAFQLAPLVKGKLDGAQSWLLLLLSACLMLLYAFEQLDGAHLPFPFFGIYALGLPFMLLAFSLPVVVAQVSRVWALRRLVLAPLASLGKSCYSIYLFHFLIHEQLAAKHPRWLPIRCYGSGFGGFVLHFAAFCALMGVFGFICRTQIEDRLIRLGRRVEKRLAPRPTREPLAIEAQG